MVLRMEVRPRDLSIYGGRDPRDLPIYTLDEAAFILGLSRSTLKAWTFGSQWQEATGRARTYVPLIIPPERADRLMLSFTNLIEAHVLYAIRRVHQIKMKLLRGTLAQLRYEFETKHPLADVDLYTSGKNILVKYETYVNMSAGKQTEMEQVIDIYVKRVERDESKIARFYPFTGEPIVAGPAVIEQPKIVSVDPFVSFGRPVVSGTNIRTEMLSERWIGGDSIDSLAVDYQIDRIIIEAALRYESARRPVDSAASAD
jgi:uncharacterized protein (DUF433 family)